MEVMFWAEVEEAAAADLEAEAVSGEVILLEDSVEEAVLLLDDHPLEAFLPQEIIMVIIHRGLQDIWHQM